MTETDVRYCQCGRCGCRSLWGPSFPCLCHHTKEELKEHCQKYLQGQQVYLPSEDFDLIEVAKAKLESVMYTKFTFWGKNVDGSLNHNSEA